MSISIKKRLGAVALSAFFAGCSSTYVKQDVEEHFDTQNCVGYTTTTISEMKGEGEDAKVVAPLLKEVKVSKVDDFCLATRYNEEVLEANLMAKIEAIRGLSNTVTISLQDPYLDREQKKQILEDIITDMNSGIEDVVKIRQGSLEKAGVTFEEIQKQYHMIKVAEDIDNTIATIYPEDGEFSPKYARYLLDEVYEGKAYPYTDLSLDNIRHYVDQALAEKNTSVEQLRHAYVQAAPQQGWEKQDDGTFKLSFDFSKFAPSKAPEQSLTPPLATPANDGAKPVTPAKPETTVRVL